MLEEAGPQVRLVNGSEHTYWTNASDGYTYWHDRQRQDSLSLLPADTLEKWLRQGSSGMAVFYDALANGLYTDRLPVDQAYRLKWLEHNIHHGLLTNDEWTWLYFEKANPWTGEGVPPAAKAAIERGKGQEKQANLDGVPHDLILDRLYVHGDPQRNCFRAVSLSMPSDTEFRYNIMGFGLYGHGVDGGQNTFAEAFPELTWDKNLFVGHGEGRAQWAANNDKLPRGSFFEGKQTGDGKAGDADWPAVGFTDYAQGDYRLATTSKYRALALMARTWVWTWTLSTPPCAWPALIEGTRGCRRA